MAEIKVQPRAEVIIRRPDEFYFKNGITFVKQYKTKILPKFGPQTTPKPSSVSEFSSVKDNFGDTLEVISLIMRRDKK